MKKIVFLSIISCASCGFNKPLSENKILLIKAISDTTNMNEAIRTGYLQKILDTDSFDSFEVYSGELSSHLDIINKRNNNNYEKDSILRGIKK